MIQKKKIIEWNKTRQRQINEKNESKLSIFADSRFLFDTPGGYLLDVAKRKVFIELNSIHLRNIQI